ncbi:hypothetical protein BGZ61DRAFT_472504 [Ilyonectria robusta]|uniref:uncharacterized protein n=1 Tax=Ilyonectria robusta TaxID=1079257 RepID=UPI001E8E3F52|nr:uncharacterized protein BGZ61DRAFT_472504 [Ilyonectria robusta]KAH8736141.1 hypothetical protein BGZ61DRAFT_472504 [Ilyonectria robusta]
MPEISSIVRGPEDEEPPVEALRDLALASNTYRDENDYWARLIDSPDVFSIFTLAAQFNIPACDLPREYGVGSGHSDRLGAIHKKVFSLGAGVSCNVIALETDESMSDICSLGTRVALKRYNAQPSGAQGIETSTKKIYQWLSSELKVLCHPYLSEHENISKLRFIAWEESSLIPSLGLELASYGTLEDCLQQLRSYGSSQRKCHLSLDIALGLAALDSVGLVHGDIKPGNIIICPHDDPERGIVAKISDLNGVALTSDYGSKHFATGSPTWQPLEVLDRDRVIDWHLADVYSFGMVMATLWSSKGYIPLGGTFLDPVMPFRLGADDKRSLTELYKITQDYEPTGMIRLAMASLPTEDVGLPLIDIVSTTLSTIPKRRMPMLHILRKHFDGFATKASRHASLASLPQSSAPDPAYWAVNSFDSLLFITRPRPFKEKVFEALLTTGESLKSSVPVAPGLEISDNFEGNDEVLMDLLKADNRLRKELIWADGVEVNEQAAIEWLRTAAEVGEGNATYWFCPLEQSMEDGPQLGLPRKKWCATSVLHGFSSDALCLKDLDKALYDTAMNMASRRRWGRDSPQIVRIEPYIERIIPPIKRNPALVDEKVEARYNAEDVGEKALHCCAAIGDMGLVRYLVSEVNANINVTNDRNETPIFYATRAGQYDVVEFLFNLNADVSHVSTEGLIILHCLTSLDDDKAAKLAPLFVDRGAKLHQPAEESPGDRIDNFVLGAGTPLFWAALKGKNLLFAALVELHCRPGQQISPAEYYVLLKALSTLHMHRDLALVLESQAAMVNGDLGLAPTPITEQVSKRFARLNLAYLDVDLTEMAGYPPMGIPQYSSVLYHALDASQVSVLHRRYIHMAEFRKAKEETIKLLLDAGADPILQEDEEDHQSMPISCTVYTGDTIAFKLFITNLESRGLDVLSILSNETLGSWSRTPPIGGDKGMAWIREKSSGAWSKPTRPG